MQTAICEKNACFIIETQMMCLYRDYGKNKWMKIIKFSSFFYFGQEKKIGHRSRVAVNCCCFLFQSVNGIAHVIVAYNNVLYS